MNQKNKDLIARRSLLTNIGIAAAATGIAVSAAPASAQSQQQLAGFEPARHDLDSWLGDLQGSHRVFIDSSTMPGGANALRYANNIITAHEDDYAGNRSDYALVICYRHASIPYAFDDAIWAKYGAGLNRAADPVPTSNPMNVATGSNGQNSIGSLVAKGVQFALCSRATRSLAGRLASQAGVSTEQVLEELLAGAIPNSRFVPAGVMTLTRAQEYGYSLLYSA